MRTKLIAANFLFSLMGLASEFSVAFMGLTHHGVSGGARTAAYMDNKLSKDGVWAINPQLNLTYHTDSNWSFNASHIRNCFNMDAFHIGVGKRFEIFENTYVGGMLGVYAYDTHSVVPQPAQASLGYLSLTLAPWITVQRDFSLSEALKASITLSTNYAITHTTVGFTYSFGK